MFGLPHPPPDTRTERRPFTFCPSDGNKEDKEQLYHCRATAAATVIITVVLLLSLLCAFPLTSSRRHRSSDNASHCTYRSTNDANQKRWGISSKRSILIPVSRHGSRAALATTNGNNSETYAADGCHSTEISCISLSTEISCIDLWQVGERHSAEANQQFTNRHSSSEAFLPRILGGLPLVSEAGSLCYMMPGCGRGSRTKNSYHRIPPSRTPENDSDYSFPAHRTYIPHWVMSTYLALHYQSTAVAMHLGSQAKQSSGVAGQEFYSLLDAIALKANAWKVYGSVALPLQIRQRRPRRKLYTDTKNYNFLELLPLPLMKAFPNDVLPGYHVGRPA